MNIIDPRLMGDVIEWADQAYPDLEEFGTPSQLLDRNDWQGWAADMLTFDGFAERDIPDPHAFTDWRQWVDRFNEVMGGA